MIKKLLLIFIFFIFGVLALYFFTILSSVYTIMGNSSYNKGKYEEALVYDEKAYTYSKDSNLKYNKALDNYKLKEYEKAETLLSEMNDSDNPKIEAKKFFALGNTLYFLGENSSSVDDTIKKWEKSLSYFQRSLDYKKSTQVQENYLFVEEKLKKLKEKQKKEQEEKQKENEQKSEENNSKEDQKSDNSDEKGESSQEEKTEEKKGDETGANSQGGQGGNNLESITEDEKKYLEGYAQYLEQKQKQNQKFFNNQSTGNGFDDIFNSFFNNPMFSNELPGNEEKDW